MRKLASIQVIREIHPIPNADAIEVAKVLGWSVVVKKGEFRVGDKVVYAEIDSKFPEKEEFEFLRKNNFIIRTVRLRGQISQGICFPLSILPPGNYEVGQDVTDIIGVKKYEPPISACLDGAVKGAFPSFIPKTDETRVQTLQNELTKYKGEVFVFTEKLDGASTTYYLNNREFGVCSRNLELIEDDSNVMWQNAKKMRIEEKLRALGRNIALQGETIGHGIQSNKYGFPQNQRAFYLFNIFDIDAHRYLNFEEFIEIANALDIPTVPVLNEHFILTDNIDELVELSKGMSILNPGTKREGIVFKEKNPQNPYQVFHFKSINPEFLLKYKDA